MTYTELTTKLTAWLNRDGMTEVTDQLGTFIDFGQRRIHRQCDLQAMEEVESLSIDAADIYVPSDFLRAKSVTIIEGSCSTVLEGTSLGNLLRYGRTGKPQMYALVGDLMYFGPPPSQTYTGQLIYFKALPILSSTVASNWISVNAPDLLLYAALMEACMFMKDDARAQIWEARFMQVKDDIEKSEIRSDKEGGGLRVRSA